MTISSPNELSKVPASFRTQFPCGDSEMARLIRDFNWSVTKLGALESWSAHLRTVVDTMILSPVPMALLWGKSGVLIYNDGYARMSGLRHPSILGCNVLEAWPEAADFNQHVLRSCLAGETLSYQAQPFFLFRNKIREQAWFDIDYSPVPGRDGVPEGVLAIVKETTGQVLADEQREKVERALLASNHALKQANADLEQFAFSASHDLQEPLRMVSVYSELLKRRLSARLDADTEVLLRHCTDGAKRLDSLLNDLLEYTRASGDPVGEPPPVSLNRIVERVLSLLEPNLQEVGASVHVAALPDVRVQAIHAQQIFQNLIGNCIKYRSERPLLIKIGASRQDDNWTFHVCDNGIGLDAKYKDQIFGLFKRLHSSSEYSGTGLGLAICRKLVDRYGGRIWVDSGLGEGCRFCFTLPLAV